jgi:hypothetical protein
MLYNKKVESLDKNLLSSLGEINTIMVFKEICLELQLMNGKIVKFKLKKILNSL